MPAPPLYPTRVPPGRPDIDIATATGVWAGTWFAGNIAGAVVVQVAGYGDPDLRKPVWVALAAALCLWVPMLYGLWWLSRRFGSGSVAADQRLSLRPVDALGVPVGVLSQLVLLPLVYWPLEQWWPSAFGRDDVERNARDLYDTAQGGWMVVLVLMVVVAAPVVEELVYRGLLQGAFSRRFDDVVAMVAVAGWFAVVHFRPVEYPGLFAFGLVLGVCVLRTGRLGLGTVAHMAFNATGLVLVAGR